MTPHRTPWPGTVMTIQLLRENITSRSPMVLLFSFLILLLRQYLPPSPQHLYSTPICKHRATFPSVSTQLSSQLQLSIIGDAMATIQLARPMIRYFSVHRPQQASRASRFIATSCLVSAVVLPFVPPALESSREKNKGYPNHNRILLSVSMLAESPPRTSRLSIGAGFRSLKRRTPMGILFFISNTLASFWFLLHSRASRCCMYYSVIRCIIIILRSGWSALLAFFVPGDQLDFIRNLHVLKGLVHE
ncbi:uncharacterized protein BJX67DRAFT_262844 [Aspergillus lucknowensis]|uniref:Uncharacterized protein n=1 Tax=Aspergillus lucknowensis TaxID=176173 RepID=A0ABR4LFJ1_9EURO